MPIRFVLNIHECKFFSLKFSLKSKKKMIWIFLALATGGKFLHVDQR